MTWVQTHSGIRFELLDPKPEMVRVEDIAHSLSRIARYNGHTGGHHPYSVAQHSVLVCREVNRRSLYCDSMAELAAALLHDAHEAYIGDLVAPLKPALDWHCRSHGARVFSQAVATLKSAIDSAIAAAFGFPATAFNHQLIADVDRVLLATEKRDLHPVQRGDWGDLPLPLREPIEPWHPVEAEARFLALFGELGLKEVQR